MNLPKHEDWIWGFHSLEACLENHPDFILDLQIEQGTRLPPKIQSLLDLSGIRPKTVGQLPRILSDKRTQGIAAKLKHFAYSFFPKFLEEQAPELLSKPGQWAVLDGIEDPRNFGALVRSAAAFGVKGVFVGQRNQASLSGVVAQASAGCVFRIPIIVCSNLNRVFDLAEENPCEFWAMDAEGLPLEAALGRTEPHVHVFWILGAEGRGVREGLFKKATQAVSIPMAQGVESLNVSVAASVAFYAAQKKYGL